MHQSKPIPRPQSATESEDKEQDGQREAYLAEADHTMVDDASEEDNGAWSDPVYSIEDNKRSREIKKVSKENLIYVEDQQSSDESRRQPRHMPRSDSIPFPY